MDDTGRLSYYFKVVDRYGNDTVLKSDNTEICDEDELDMLFQCFKTFLVAMGYEWLENYDIVKVNKIK